MKSCKRFSPADVILTSDPDEVYKEVLVCWDQGRHSEAAIMAYDAMKKTDRGTWQPFVILGLYLTKWRGLYSKDLSDVKGSLKEINALVKQYGSDDTARAVVALFSTELEWVRVKTLDFLTSDRNWSKYVTPAMKHVAKSIGEQSEFGKSDRVKRSRRF